MENLNLLEATMSVEDAILTHASRLSPEERAKLIRELALQNRQDRVQSDAVMRKHLGAWLRRSRKERGISQAALADSMGLSRPAVASLEAGRQGCSVEQLVAFCGLLNQNPWESLEEILNWPGANREVASQVAERCPDTCGNECTSKGGTEPCEKTSCSCFHASEQHGRMGCSMMGCGCAWDGQKHRADLLEKRLKAERGQAP